MAKDGKAATATTNARAATAAKKARAASAAKNARAASAAEGRQARKARPHPAAAVEPAERAYEIRIRWLDDGAVREIVLPVSDRGFYPDVQRWRYVVANRRRITRATRDSISRDLQDWLAARCGRAPEALAGELQSMAGAERVEVESPALDDDTGYAARLFPWETALALLTRPLRDDAQNLTVVRHLNRRDGRPLAKPVPGSLLLVRSGPGELQSRFDLERECEMVERTLAPRLGRAVTWEREPDRKALYATISAKAPAVVHLSGVDGSALQGFGLQSVDPEAYDGFVLRRSEQGYDVVRAQELPRLVASAAEPPLLVAVSSCFSAARLAALMVAEGARYAIGFFDTLTDADAMAFFGTFYREWALDWNLLRAFEVARVAWTMRQTGPSNSGVVLWCRHSLIKPDATVTTAKGARALRLGSASVDDLALDVELMADAGSADPRGARTSLNYSLLHNGRSPFRLFSVDKPKPGRLPPLEVEVVLEVGAEPCRCRFAEQLPEAADRVDLLSRIRLPLVAGMLRQCTESLRTNLYIKVVCGDRLLRETSERVTVLPADEWRDDGEDHRWLPSFVLPRDPRVLEVIGGAQRYLRTLLDDCTAGFDGYQRLAADDANRGPVVDPQVQAIWAALQHDARLNYINPPPSYSSRSQRLRSPSEVFRGQAATCVDLALLFASCLEFVGIYPVLFLIEGHAFPGYWRSDKGWWRMKQFRYDPADLLPADPAASIAGTVGKELSEPWMFGGANLGELMRYVQDGTLVPFESTFVAAQRGFFDALEQGAVQLHPDTFDAMVDVQTARGFNVTPLPLFDKFA